MKTWCEYLDGVFTAIVLPEATGKFPTVIMRCPYVDGYKNWEDEKIPPHYAKIFSSWVEHGYAGAKATGSLSPLSMNARTASPCRLGFVSRTFITANCF